MRKVFSVYRLNFRLPHASDIPDGRYMSNLSGSFHITELWFQDMFDTREEAENWIHVRIAGSCGVESYTIQEEYHTRIGR